MSTVVSLNIPLIVKWTRQLDPDQLELSTTPRVPAGTSCENNPPSILTSASTLSPCENIAIVFSHFIRVDVLKAKECLCL